MGRVDGGWLARCHAASLKQQAFEMLSLCMYVCMCTLQASLHILDYVFPQQELTHTTCACERMYCVTSEDATASSCWHASFLVAMCTWHEDIFLCSSVCSSERIRLPCRNTVNLVLQSMYVRVFVITSAGARAAGSAVLCCDACSDAAWSASSTPMFRRGSEKTGPKCFIQPLAQAWM